MQCAAFLKAINVGGHVVKMDRLRAIFAELGYANAETVIASGNVLFETRARDMAPVERKLAAGLEAALGYAVPTFVRTASEVATIAEATPFPRKAMDNAFVVNVGFLDQPLGRDAAATMRRLTTENDEFHTEGREFWWLCHTRQSESPFFKVRFEKAFGADVTFRNLNTVRRMAERMAH